MIGQDINIAKKLLEEGKLVGIPTETVYGLAANALNTDAVLEVFRVKNRPHLDPMIIHLSSWDKVNDYVVEVHEKLNLLATSLIPGPITFLLKKKPNVSDIITSGSEYVAVRIPSHPIALELLQSIDFPLAAPSANPFGYISPTSAQHVEDQLGGHIPYILDGGPCQIGIESTIVGMVGNVPVIYRKGGVSIESINKICGKLLIHPNSNASPKAPGMLTNHYAPHKKLVFGEPKSLIDKYAGQKIGLITFKDRFPDQIDLTQIVLSKRGSYKEAAKNLFSAMRQMDKSPVDIIIAQQFPELDLGVAINDRLRRAAL